MTNSYQIKKKIGRMRNINKKIENVQRKKLPLKSTSADCWKWEMVVPRQGTHEVTLICTEIESEREIHRSHDINFP